MSREKRYRQLQQHAAQMQGRHIRDLFALDAARGKNFSIELTGMMIDYSKNLVTDETLRLLLRYSDAVNTKDAVEAMVNGEKINLTEDRAVLHTALRSGRDKKIIVDGIDVIEQVHTQLEKIESFSSAFHAGEVKGWSGKPLDTVVNIGIGGAALGPKLVVDALDDFIVNDTKTYFISNVDYEQIESLKKRIDPQSTLFIISSKSFITRETLTNADSLKTWLQDSGCNRTNKHFLAVTADKSSAIDYGIEPENVFTFGDWVGGRFSLWSVAGLSIALSVGYKNFAALLTGARELDDHFKQAPHDKNAPVILALLDFWYNNFMNAHTHAFIPYDESLKYFPDYVAQLFMESNGKSTDTTGKPTTYNTAPITWGAVGTDAQHAFFQLLHQGTHTVPVDFLVPLKKNGDKTHHVLMLANCLAQGRALMSGETNTDPHHHFAGNKPSNTILYNQLTPSVLGALLALYEHRAFVQGVLWGINSFDQWGVESGKKLAAKIYDVLDGGITDDALDSSTQNLIEKFKRMDN